MLLIIPSVRATCPTNPHLHRSLEQYLVTEDRVAPHAMSSSPVSSENDFGVHFLQLTLFIVYSQNHFEHTAPCRMIHTLRIGFLYTLLVYMILTIAEIKNINKSQLEALERKKKNKKAVSIPCSMADGTWWWVLEEHLSTKIPALQVP